MQLYRGMETVTAAPSAGEQAAIPHHLYSIADPADSLDAARYRKLALPVLEEIEARGKLPIVVGGSGLYLKFLTHGPNDLPSDPDLRRELEALSLDELNRRLEELDPIEAARVDRNNPRYVQRSLEVCLLTGRPISEQRASFEIDTSHLRGLVLNWEPAPLEERIRIRTRSMMEGGAVEEVAAHPSLGESAAKAIGVPEIRRLLDGEITPDECEELIVVATRQYAKRQRTWFRREKWLTPVAGDSTPDEIVAAATALL